MTTSSAHNVARAAPVTSTFAAPVAKPVKRTGPRGTSSNAYASGANQNCGNVITDRPSTRVHAPPGGRSSGPLW